jgi:hypothetical protein
VLWNAFSVQKARCMHRDEKELAGAQDVVE